MKAQSRSKVGGKKGNPGYRTPSQFLAWKPQEVRFGKAGTGAGSGKPGTPKRGHWRRAAR